MNDIIINKSSKTPIFRQISDYYIGLIQNGVCKEYDQMPSINEISQKCQIAKETVVKAYQELKDQNYIHSVRGKGYFISALPENSTLKIMLVIDKLSSYKQSLVSGIVNSLGPNHEVNVFFHHFDISVFKMLIENNIGQYTHYVVVPFSHVQIEEVISLIPVNNVYILDILPDEINSRFPGIYQDFETDIYEMLLSLKDPISQYESLTLIDRPKKTMIPNLINRGFKRFCIENNVEFDILSSASQAKISDGVGYIVVDDNDLIDLLILAKESNKKTGQDFGILSYNESPLKKVVSDGISVISTDFYLMGEKLSEMIINQKKELLSNKFIFIDRGSF